MSDYWVKRALERLRRADLLADGYEAKIFKLYQESFDELSGELKALFQHYVDQSALSPIEAAEYLRAPVTRAQADAILQKLSEVEDPNVRRRLLAQANSAQVSARMKRIQAMQENIKAECAKIADKEIAIHQEAARKIGADAYYRTVFDTQQGINAVMPFAQITIDKIDAVLSQRWAGENYSARVWQNAEAMAQKLGELIRTNVAAGRPWEQCIDDVQQFMATPDQGGYYAAARLLRTETMHVYNEMSAEASSALGAEQYRYIAVLDLKTSEICRLHDGLIDPDTGKPYTYKNRKPGINFPPLHPWCRSIEAPYINEGTLKDMTRPARDPVTGKIVQVPATMTYQEWYKAHVLGNSQSILNERMIKNTATDRTQWQSYRDRLGKEAPKNLAEFQRIKYAGDWADLRARYRATRQETASKPEQYSQLDPMTIEPVNQITDAQKKNALAWDFHETGYKGRPILVVEMEKGQYKALTGSHRIFAARESGIVIPSKVVGYDDSLIPLLEAKGDEERLKIANSLYSSGKIDAETLSLISEEDRLNYVVAPNQTIKNKEKSVKWIEYKEQQAAAEQASFAEWQQEKVKQETAQLEERQQSPDMGAYKLFLSQMEAKYPGGIWGGMTGDEMEELERLERKAYKGY